MKNDYIFKMAGGSPPRFKNILTIMGLITFFLIVGLMPLSASVNYHFLNVGFLQQQKITIKGVVRDLEGNNPSSKASHLHLNILLPFRSYVVQ